MPGGSRVQIPPSLFVASLFNNADGTTARDIHSKSSSVRALLGVSGTAAITGSCDQGCHSKVGCPGRTFHCPRYPSTRGDRRDGADMTRRERGTHSRSPFPQESGLFEHICIGSTTIMTTASSAPSALPHRSEVRILLPTKVPWIGAGRHTQQCFQQASRSTDVQERCPLPGRWIGHRQKR